MSYFVIEMSSFQLEYSKYIKPNHAIFTNFTKDHLDWHGNMNNYIKSKLKIFPYKIKMILLIYLKIKI